MPKTKAPVQTMGENAVDTIIDRLAKQLYKRLDQLAVKKLALSVEEAAFVLSVSKFHVYELIRRHELEVIRMGDRQMRISVKVLEDFVAKGGIEKGT